MDAPLAGVVPVVPTIFHDDETVDLDGTARVVDYLIDAGVDGRVPARQLFRAVLADRRRNATRSPALLLERVAGRRPRDRHHQPLQRRGSPPRAAAPRRTWARRW